MLKSAEFLKERGFFQKMGFGKKPAVLVIDLINAFTNPEHPLGADLSVPLRETKRILEVARERQIPIYYTTVHYEPNNFGTGIWYLKMIGLKTLLPHSQEVEIDASLERRPEEGVIIKKYASAFFGTDLVSRLVTNYVDTIIVTGCTTSGCVRATVVDGIQYGFRPIIPLTAVGDRLPEAHDQSLFDMNAKYGDVVSVEEVIDYLNKQKL